MNFTDSQYKKLKNLFDNSESVFVIHWTRQNLTDNEGGVSTPRIVGIFVRSLDGAITKTFAIHLEAEKAGFTSEGIEIYYDQLEEQVLRDFFKFTKEYSTNKWVYWDSDDPHIGFEATAHRYKVLVGKGFDGGEQEEENDIFEIPAQYRVNLNSCLKEIYGANYEKPPQFQNLIKSNNEGQPISNLLTLEEEARCFMKSQYPLILLSLQNKVDFLIDVVRNTVYKKLKVRKKNLISRLGLFFSHPIMIAIAWTATVTSFILALFF